MSVLAHNAPARPAGESRSHDWHAITTGVQTLAIVALAVYLSLGVTWWFAPLSALLIGVTAWAGLGRSGATITRRPSAARTTLAEVPMVPFQAPYQVPYQR